MVAYPLDPGGFSGLVEARDRRLNPRVWGSSCSRGWGVARSGRPVLREAIGRCGRLIGLTG
jgi:hypothetical protein